MPGPAAGLRPPGEVMRLARMGASYPTRLSFGRTLVRRLVRDRARVRRPVWEIDRDGHGRAVYSLDLGGRTYSLVAFSQALEPERRTDRVIAEAWDTSYALVDGEPARADLDRLEAQVPRQEAGRYQAGDLVLSRANKSVRLFEHVASRLAEGTQPDREAVVSTGYLMRTTAVYGNGKFGIADRERIVERPELSGPFQGEMLTVWLIRGFSHDLVEHVARMRSPERAVTLDRRLKRHLGIGNATGLGMAPFLVNHPILINNWMMARETALSRVRGVRTCDTERARATRGLLARAGAHLEEWNVGDARQMRRIEIAREEIATITRRVDAAFFSAPFAFDRLLGLAEGCSLETQELVAALVLEPNGDLVDDLADCMASGAGPRLDPAMRLGALRDLIGEQFAWALTTDFSDARETARFWYVSEEKLEPRLGRRHEEPGAERELRLDIARQVQSLARDLDGAPAGTTLAVFLMEHPEHRHAARRVQASATHPYAEIHDNLIGEDCEAIDLLRCKLAFFGAAKFDPKSDRWTRITLFQGAPLADEVDDERADDWWLPVHEGVE
ncbi:MAG: hypothetical protein GC150_00755 [Rhizobiales bacterium]|nr:hypothetical protein [Hyphomicrobiales bacterium]